MRAETRRQGRAARPLDALDRQLLAALRDDARLPIVQLGRLLGLGHAAVHERVRRLQALGYLQGFHARLNYAALGLGLGAYLGLQTEQSESVRARLAQELRQMPEVEDLAWVTGEFDALVKVRARDTAHLQRVLFQIIQAGGGRLRSRTMVILSEPLWKPGPSFEEIAPD